MWVENTSTRDLPAILTELVGPSQPYTSGKLTTTQADLANSERGNLTLCPRIVCKFWPDPWLYTHPGSSLCHTHYKAMCG